MGDVEEFGVEAESVDGLSGEDDFTCLGGEAFESALGISETGEPYESKQEVEGPSHGLPVKCLAYFDLGIGQGSGTDDDAGAGVEGGPELGQLFDGGGGVCVEEDAKTALGVLQHASANGEAFAAVLGQGHGTQGYGTGRLDGLHFPKGLVGAAVIDDDDFGSVGLGDEIGQGFAQGLSDARFFVVGWNDQGQMHDVLSGNGPGATPVAVREWPQDLIKRAWVSCWSNRGA